MGRQGRKRVRSQDEWQPEAAFVKRSSKLRFARQPGIVHVRIRDAAGLRRGGRREVHELKPAEHPKTQIGDQKVRRAFQQASAGGFVVCVSLDGRD